MDKKAALMMAQGDGLIRGTIQAYGDASLIIEDGLGQTSYLDYDYDYTAYDSTTGRVMENVVFPVNITASSANGTESPTSITNAEYSISSTKISGRRPVTHYMLSITRPIDLSLPVKFVWWV